MQKLEDILKITYKMKPGYAYLDYVKEVYNGVSTTIDISEAVNTAAGIDLYNRDVILMSNGGNNV